MIGAGGMHYNGEGVFLTFGNSIDLQFQDAIYVEPFSSINNYPKVILNNSEIFAVWVDATNKEILFTNLNESDSMSNESQNIIITDENVTQVAEPKLVFYNNNLFTVWTDNRSGVNNVYFSSTQEIDIIAGDVNSDEFVNVLDILMVVNHIIGHLDFNVSQLLAADLNNDNIINILDVIQIINIILSVN